MEPHNKTFKILTKYKKINETSDINLSDKVISYYNGKSWCIVPLDIAISYPIIYDTYKTEQLFDIDISIFTCPFTLYSCIFEGKLTISDFTYENILVLLDNEKLIKINSNGIKKHMTEVKTFRNSISDHPDYDFLYINKNKYKKHKVNDDLARIIEYHSSHDVAIKKYSIIKTGFDTMKSKFDKYIDTMKEKLQEKNSFITCILFSQLPKHSTLFTNYKIIHYAGL